MITNLLRSLPVSRLVHIGGVVAKFCAAIGGYSFFQGTTMREAISVQSGTVYCRSGVVVRVLELIWYLLMTLKMSARDSSS